MTESPTNPPTTPGPEGNPPRPAHIPSIPPAAAPPVPPASAAQPGPVQPADTPPAAPQPAASVGSGPQQPDVLDAGTYTALKESRSAARLALDGTWHQISPRYVISQFVQEGIFAALILIAAFVVHFAFEQVWVWIPAGLVLLVMAFTMIILPRQARAIGYMLRDDDIVFRRGILWQRIIAVPYGRMQLVDITHGPLDRAFGVAQLKMVTAAATTGVQIPGLTQAAAETLRDTLIHVAETRRTGL